MKIDSNTKIEEVAKGTKQIMNLICNVKDTGSNKQDNQSRKLFDLMRKNRDITNKTKVLKK